jgi:hypothetical protein
MPLSFQPDAVGYRKSVSVAGGTIARAPCRLCQARSAKNGFTTRLPQPISLGPKCRSSWNGSTGQCQIDPVLKAAEAHLWFVTIHPFDDGNGRIARAIADLALSRSERSPKRFYSMSAQIRLERGDYYDILEQTQKGSLDITAWMRWFLGCLDRAFDGAAATLASML